MTQSLLDTGLHALEFSRGALLALAEDIPPDKWCHQPAPGLNHALWVLGHVAWADDFFLGALDGQPTKLGERWSREFGMKSTPRPSLAEYPSVAEVKAGLAAARDRLRSWFQSMNAAKLATALPQDFLNFAPKFGALMFSIAWHEGLHTGQLTVCRKSMGLKPKFA